jgi:predicted MFS family arabinose efflux permease
VRLVARLLRLIWGGEVDRALRPVLAVGLAGSIAGGAMYPFLGIWAIKHLGASQTALSIGFLGGALAAGAVGYLGGHLSDHIGRRPLILVGWAGQILGGLGLLLVGHHVVLGLVVMASFASLGALGGSASTAMVADLVPPEKHEAAYAAVRVANNLGISIGPPLGALLLIGQHWPRLFVGAAVFGLFGLALAYRYIPRRGLYAPEKPPQRGSFGVIRRDRAFLLFMGSAVFASMTYVAFESLLPISLVSSHGLAPAAWGFLLVINPILVTLVQLRLTRATSRIAPALKLAVAMPLMGLPFLLLNVSSAIPVVALVVLVFVFGEMLWVPTSQAVVSAMAPADVRGAYMGVFGGSWAVAWALAPFFGLQVRSAFGDSVMWVCVAAISLIAGATGAAAARGRGAISPEAVASAA